MGQGTCEPPVISERYGRDPDPSCSDTFDVQGMPAFLTHCLNSIELIINFASRVVTPTVILYWMKAAPLGFGMMAVQAPLAEVKICAVGTAWEIEFASRGQSA